MLPEFTANMNKLITSVLMLVVAITMAHCTWVKEMENPGMFEGDMQLDPDEREGVLKGNTFASIKGGRWPGGKVPYEITSRIGSRGRSAIRDAIGDYHKYTCLKFVPRTSESAYISFYVGGGCSSPVGYRRGRKNSISLAGGCQYKGTTIHEIGHSIGLYHEQSRPDRDSYVRILWNNIQGSMKFNFNKHSKNSIDSLGTPYDFRSIMHYGATAFGSGRRTIETINSNNQRLIGSRSGFSQIDIKQINLMYKCGDTRPTPSANPSAPPTLPPVSVPPGCNNKDKNCQHWALNGWCTDNKEKGYMASNCCAACTGAPCKDRHSRCNEWATRNPNECVNNPDYMHRICQVSCKKC